MTADIETSNLPHLAAGHRPESRARVRYSAPFLLRCGALLIDYIVLILIMTVSTMIARLIGGGARMAGGTAEKVGIVLTLVMTVIDFGVLAGLTGRTIGKWTTGLRIERMSGGTPGILRACLRHFIGYPLSLVPFGLGFLMVTVSPRGRALHDLIVGTIVVRSDVSVAPPVRRTRGSV